MRERAGRETHKQRVGKPAGAGGRAGAGRSRSGSGTGSGPRNSPPAPGPPESPAPAAACLRETFAVMLRRRKNPISRYAHSTAQLRPLTSSSCYSKSLRTKTSPLYRGSKLIRSICEGVVCGGAGEAGAAAFPLSQCPFPLCYQIWGGAFPHLDRFGLLNGPPMLQFRHPLLQPRPRSRPLDGAKATAPCPCPTGPRKGALA